MPDTIEDIVSQARQGSMAAIIQVLNERLADQGVRTRAILQEGVLQVLCEAPTAEPLTRDALLPRVREILESIEPRKLRRARISSRIAQDQQVIWLEDIHRNPNSQLLWSEAIVLRRPNLFQRLSRRSPARASTPKVLLLPPADIVKKPKPPASEELTFWRGLAGGVLLSAISFLLGWGYQHWRVRNFGLFSGAEPAPEAPALSSPTSAAMPSPSPEAPPSPEPTTVLVPPETGATSPPPPASPTPADPFAAAVRLAESGAVQGQTATTAEQWQALAQQWQQAAALMRAVPADDPRYPMAQERSQVYEQNSGVAQQRAAAAAP